jgi:teichuronic acid biosynthesis glycosyltransferase TuaH
VDLPAPVAGFVGHLNSRTDLALLEAVSATGASLLLLGPRDPSFEPDRFEALLARPHVSYVGPRRFEELLPYLKKIDVGLVPYANTQFNRNSFPLKTLEYLAAGRPVVSTPLPAVRSLRTDLVALAETPEDFAAAVMREAGRDREPGLLAERRAFAAEHSWAARAEQLAGLLGLGSSSNGHGANGHHD